MLVILCAGLFLTAYATDWIGIHPALGAFLFGVVIPRGMPAVERSAVRVRAVSIPVLLPLYFADLGLHTDLVDLPSGQWGWALAILAVAVVGKWCGAAGAARLTGADWRWAATIGSRLLREAARFGRGAGGAAIVVAMISAAGLRPLLWRLCLVTVVATSGLRPVSGSRCG